MPSADAMSPVWIQHSESRVAARVCSESWPETHVTRSVRIAGVERGAHCSRRVVPPSSYRVAARSSVGVDLRGGGVVDRDGLAFTVAEKPVSGDHRAPRGHLPSRTRRSARGARAPRRRPTLHNASGVPSRRSCTHRRALGARRVAKRARAGCHPHGQAMGRPPRERRGSVRAQGCGVRPGASIPDSWVDQRSHGGTVGPVVVVTATRERVRGDIVRLVHRGLGVPDFSRAVTRILPAGRPLRRVLPPDDRPGDPAADRRGRRERPSRRGDGPAHRDRAAGAGLQQVRRARTRPRRRPASAKPPRVTSTGASVSASSGGRPSGFEDELRRRPLRRHGDVGRPDAAPRGEASPLHARRGALRGVAGRAPGRRSPAGPRCSATRSRRRHGSADGAATATPGSWCSRPTTPSRWPTGRPTTGSTSWAPATAAAGISSRSSSSPSPPGPAGRRGRRRPRRRRRPGPGPHLGGALGGRAGLAPRRRPRLPGRRPAGGGPSARAGAADRRRLRLHRTRAAGHRAGGAGPLDERDRRAAAPVGVHRAGPPEVDLREVRYRFTRRSRGPALLRPLRTAPLRRWRPRAVDGEALDPTPR